jgi:oligopeptide/dipeptide ABC transporter ATP-binding protein
MPPLLEVRSLVKHFPVKGSRAVVQAVNGVSFVVDRGQTLGLIGESGSGKTTVGRCILKLTEPTQGEIVFDGQPTTHLAPRAFRPLRRRIQMVFQDPFRSLNPRMSVRDTLREPLMLHGIGSPGEHDDRVRELICRVELLPDDLRRFPHQLSGGQQQRVGIARALATQPDLIVLDEPTSSLDITIRGRITDLLVNLQAELGLSYVYISHDLTTVEHLCHRVAVMYLGSIVETGTKDQVFATPRHPYSKALLSSALAPDPGVRKTPYLLTGEIPSPINLPAGCPLRSRCPEAVDSCQERFPAFVDVGGGHQVACVWARPAQQPAAEPSLRAASPRHAEREVWDVSAIGSP